MNFFYLFKISIKPLYNKNRLYEYYFKVQFQIKDPYMFHSLLIIKVLKDIKIYCTLK